MIGIGRSFLPTSCHHESTLSPCVQLRRRHLRSSARPPSAARTQDEGSGDWRTNLPWTGGPADAIHGIQILGENLHGCCATVNAAARIGSQRQCAAIVVRVDFAVDVGSEWYVARIIDGQVAVVTEKEPRRRCGQAAGFQPVDDGVNVNAKAGRAEIVTGDTSGLFELMVKVADSETFASEGSPAV